VLVIPSVSIPWPNTLAYLSRVSATKKKSFIESTPGLNSRNALKYFFSLKRKHFQIKDFIDVTKRTSLFQLTKNQHDVIVTLYINEIYIKGISY
jgi:hypothetical protein